MKLTQIHIHNFRGALDESFDLHDYTLLVGPNNAGKSTVIDALRAFYEKDKFTFKKDNDFPFIPTSDEESWIEVEFALTAEEKESLAEESVVVRMLNRRPVAIGPLSGHDLRPLHEQPRSAHANL